jgi:hypothetical protein
MSKARLVITAVTVEKRPVSEVAKAYGVARSWVCALLARYQAKGEAAFEPRSRRPKTSCIRFAAEMPNECWQSDFARYPLAGGADTEILTWLDGRLPHHRPPGSPA